MENKIKNKTYQNVYLKKKFLLEDEEIITEENKLKHNYKNFSIMDLRFFETNIQQIPILISIDSVNIDSRILELFKEMHPIIITNDKIVK